MRDWNNIDHRREATLLFRDYMQNHPDTRQSCIDSPSVAKQEFALRGDIQIPAAVEFKVYGATDDARHNLAVLVLPSSGGGITTEPANILIAAWPVWGPIRARIVELENQLAMLRGEEIAELQNQLDSVREALAAQDQSPP